MAPEASLVRSYDVGTSVEALASAWARREAAPEGAVVVVTNEVAGRLRGGEPWLIGGGDAVLMAVVTRPSLDPMQEALLWLPASLAAMESIAEATSIECRLRWPDRLVDAATAATWGATNVITQLGPGRIEHSIFSLRIDKRSLRERHVAWPGDEGVVERFVHHTQRFLELLRTDAAAVLDAYADRCDLLGERVRAELLPRGEARGRVVAVDADGFLVLESPTGMLERVAPSTLRSLEIVSVDDDQPC